MTHGAAEICHLAPPPKKIKQRKKNSFKKSASQISQGTQNKPQYGRQMGKSPGNTAAFRLSIIVSAGNASSPVSKKEYVYRRDFKDIK